MNVYLLLEVAAVALVAIFLGEVNPSRIGSSVIVVGLGYCAFCCLSGWAFQEAVQSGHVKPSPSNDHGERKAYFIAQGCPDMWLVRRYIRTLL